MSTEKVVVILRQLPDNEKFVSHVKKIPSGTVKQEEHYAEFLMRVHSEEFCSQFVEFKNATWFYQIMDLW